MKFKDAYRAANDNVHVRSELLEEMRCRQAKEAVETPNRRQSRRAWWVAIPTAVAATALACVAVFVGLKTGWRNLGAKTADQSNEKFVTGAAAEESVAEEIPMTAEAGMALKTYGTYEEIAEQIALRSGMRTGNAIGDTIEFSDSAVKAPDVPAEMPMPTGAASIESNAGSYATQDDGLLGNGDYRSESGTNVQVVGVDEADIVKTDGKWLYCLNRNDAKLYVVSADGKNSKVTASATLPQPKKEGSIDYSEMILSGDRLYVIGTEYNWSGTDSDTEYTRIEVYDLGDRTSVKRIDTLKQQGSYRTARLVGDMLVTVSCKYVWIYDYTKDIRIDTWCPHIMVGGETKLLEPNDLYINTESKDNSYVLITTVDAKTGEKFDSFKAIFGGCDTVYCNGENLLIASREWENEQGEEQTAKDGKHFVKSLNRTYTSLSLFRLDGGKIEPKATQKIEGSLLNQFSMDAYAGTYRLVVTRNGSETTIWTDGIDTYEYKQIRDCALYLFDEALQPLGTLNNLAEDEMVQSVRFMGDVAYFVTFRQTDPLFAVDCSDPAHPAILSKLKIPGFSAYLHPFGAGKLIGIGYDADEESGRTTGIKLTLFDISDPADVKELFTKKVKDADYTSVQQNHHSVFVDSVSGTVAFPADNRYYVYRVSEDGFNEIGRVEVNELFWYDDMRGFAIDDVFYVVSEEAVTVLSFDSMEMLVKIKF